MPPRLNRKQRKNEIQFQVVRDENGEVVFRTLQAPRGVKTREDLQKHLPADFPLDIIEENNGKVQTRFSREGDGFDDGEDAALAERLLKDMTLHDIGFNDNDDGDDDMDFDFDDVDEVVDYDELDSEYGGNNNARNAKLIGGGTSNDYVYDYNKHFKAMTPHSTFFIPGVGITIDPEADEPIIPVMPVIDDVFEEDLKNDLALKERSEKISQKVKKTIHSEISGLDLPIFESSGYKFTDDFLHPLVDGDIEGYEELEDNIFELLLQSDGEQHDDDDNDNDDPFGFGAMTTREDIIAKMRNKGGDVPNTEDEPQSKLMSLADFDFGSDGDEGETDIVDQEPKSKSNTTKNNNNAALTKKLKNFNLASALKKINKTSTTTTTTTTPSDQTQQPPTTTTSKTPKSKLNNNKAKGVSFSSKSIASNGQKSKQVTTKGVQKYGSSPGDFDDYGYDDESEEFNPDDMFGYGDDDDITMAKSSTNDNDDDPDFGYGDDEVDATTPAGNDDEDYDDEDYEDEQDQVDLQIQEKLKARIRAQYSADDDVTVQIESYDDDGEEEDADFSGEGESYDPFDDGEGEFDDVMSQYLQKMTSRGGDDDEDYEDEDEDYYDDEDYEDDEYDQSRRGQNRDQALTVVPTTDPILAEKDYALFQRLVNVYECDNSTDEEEFENGEYQDEDDEKYMFHINRDGATLKNPDIRRAISEFHGQKASIQKEYGRMRSRLKPNVKEFIRNSVIEQQATPQPSLEQLRREIDRQFAKKKQSRLDVQSMRTTLSTTANVPTLIKEVRIRPAKRIPGTKPGTTAIVADVQIVGSDGLPVIQESETTKGPRSVSFADELAVAPRQIQLNQHGVPIGVMEKHRAERQQKEAEYKANLATTTTPSSSKPRLQLNFTQPVSVSFEGKTQQFPITTPDEEKITSHQDNNNDGDDDQEDYDEDDQEDEDDEDAVYIPGARRSKKETAEERALRKKIQKEHKQQRRVEKKKTKTMYKDETKKSKHQQMVIKFTNPAHKKLM